jgi:3',5'-cyclic AMP phosphodiesterase CpdA
MTNTIRAAAALVSLISAAIAAQATPQRVDSTVVVAIAPARNPLPSEAASAGITKFSFIAYGDTRGRQDGVAPQHEHGLVVNQMLQTIRSRENGPSPIKFVLQSGDAVVNGGDPKQWNVSFVGLINRITAEGGVPYFLAPGNHDVTGSGDLNSPGRRNALGNYLRAMQQLIPPDKNARRLDGYPTYAFGYGNTFVLAFDSNIAGDSVQYAWVKKQLEGLDRKRYVNIIAFMHHPVYSTGPHGGSIIERPTAELRARYMPLFRQQGVKLLFVGHEHFYEHWVERYRDSTGRPRRMDQIVSGGGGAPLYTFQGYPDLRQYHIDGARDSVRARSLVRPSTEQGENPYHYVVVHVDGENIRIDVVGVDWGRSFAPYRSNRAVLSDSIP